MLTRRHLLMCGIATLVVSAAHASQPENRFFPEDFGARGDGVADDSGAINACDQAASAEGATVTFRNSYRVAKQLLMSANWHFEGGEIIRDWTGRHNAGQKDLSATICGRGNDPLSRFYIDPGPYVPTGVLRDLALTGRGTVRMSRAARSYYDANRNAHAAVLYMLCDNFRIEGPLRLALGGNDWCVAYGGDNFEGSDFEIYSETGSAAIYEDGFHVIYGHNGRLFRPIIESGDDSIAFANTYNLPISHWTVDSPTVFSHVAFGIKIASQRLGATASFGRITQALEDIHVLNPTWADPRGRRSHNGYVRFDASGARPGIIRNCSVRGGRFDGRNNGLPRGRSSGVAAVSFAGPIEKCFVQARVRNPSLWTAQMSAGSDGAGPSESGFDIHAPDAPNWAGAKAVQAVDLRGAGRGNWVAGEIVNAR